MRRRSVTRFQPDLRIGRGASLARMKGNHVYNNTGMGQDLDLSLEKLKGSTCHFALQNDGNETDRLRIKELRRSSTLRTQYFRLTGGRRNVTGRFIRTGLIEESVNPGQIIRYQGWVKYLSSVNRPSQNVRMLARSLNDVTKVDAARVDVRSLRFHDDFR